jgi:chorismate synthase
LGSDFFGGIEALLSTLFFSIPAVKGVEFGDGFKLSESYGSMTNDAIYADENKNIFSKTNHMGGILGGISNGMDIVTNIAIKPTPSISIEQDSINYKTFQPVKTKVTGRHDPCIVPRALVVGEAMMAIGLLELTEEKNE